MKNLKSIGMTVALLLIPAQYVFGATEPKSSLNATQQLADIRTNITQALKTKDYKAALESLAEVGELKTASELANEQFKLTADVIHLLLKQHGGLINKLDQCDAAKIAKFMRIIKQQLWIASSLAYAAANGKTGIEDHIKAIKEELFVRWFKDSKIKKRSFGGRSKKSVGKVATEEAVGAKPRKKKPYIIKKAGTCPISGVCRKAAEKNG